MGPVAPRSPRAAKNGFASLRSRYARGSSPWCAGARGGVAVGDGPRGVGGSVAAVGARGEHHEVVPALELEGGGEGEFLAAPAEALAAHRHRGLAARDQAGGRWHWPAARRDRAAHGHQLARDLSRLAVQRPRRHMRRQPELARLATRPRRPRADCCRSPTLLTRSKIGSSGFGVSGDLAARPTLEPIADRAAARARGGRSGRGSPGPRRTWRHRGPSAPSRSRRCGSPITSERSRAATRAGAAARASCPPLSSEQCLRTALSWVMSAPAARRRRVMACLSPSVIGGAGAGVSAEAPPEIKVSTRSSAPAASRERQEIAAAAVDPRASGHRVSRLDERHAAGLGQVAVLDHDEAAGHAVAPRFLDRPRPWPRTPCPRRRPRRAPPAA